MVTAEEEILTHESIRKKIKNNSKITVFQKLFSIIVMCITLPVCCVFFLGGGKSVLVCHISLLPIWLSAFI